MNILTATPDSVNCSEPLIRKESFIHVDIGSVGATLPLASPLFRASINGNVYRGI